MAEELTITKVKTALGAQNVTDEGLVTEISDLIDAARADMTLAGVVLPSESPEQNALILRAIITYCKLNYGEGTEYDKLKRSYDEQKAQLKTSTGFTDWGFE